MYHYIYKHYMFIIIFIYALFLIVCIIDVFSDTTTGRNLLIYIMTM